MKSSNFQFLSSEFPILYNIAQAAEYHVHNDPVTCLFKLRQLGEKLTVYICDTHHVAPPNDPTFHNWLKELEYESILPQTIQQLFHNLKKKGNVAVHQNRASADDAKGTLLTAFKLSKWFYETYSDDMDDVSGLRFSVPEHRDVRQELAQVERDYAALEKKFNELLAQKEAEPISEQKQEAIKERGAVAAQRIDLSEEETRTIIDDQLRQAGWEVDSQRINYRNHQTLPEKGKNKAIAEWKAGRRWADYALFIGEELYAIVEAKPYAQDISTNLRQAKNCAELVEEKYGAKLLGEWRACRVPFLFSTNGRPYLEQIKTKSGIWFLDTRRRDNTSRPLQAWYSPDGLKYLYEQDTRASHRKLARESTDFLRDPSGLRLRDYQVKAIEKVEEAIRDDQRPRRALLAMATGTGKTRTTLGLCYRLIKTNRFRRILFLVDRTILGLQALNTFKDQKIEDLNTFADIYQLEDLKTALPDIDTRLHFATVQGLVRRLFFADEESDQTPLTVDAYDCIIVDEAHRGYLLDKEIDEDDLAFKNQMDYVSKYRRVLEYFDAYRIGLTATPALHTTDIFGKPVFTYSYREAVVDGYLIDHEPPVLIKTKLSEEGITWEKGEQPKGYDPETNEIVDLDTLEDELKIEVDGFNRLVITEEFNRTVIRELVNHLDPEGEEKTLVFAATDEHADLIVQLFKNEFAEIGVPAGEDMIQKITGKVDKVPQLVKRLRNERFPNIAVTVDLLTTGVDVPAICNLVFLRRVKSRILYEQMLGRATRRCDDIGKETFTIFDAVRIYEVLEEFTHMKPVVPNPQTSFNGLVDEFRQLEGSARQRKQVEQVLAKLQRKKHKITGQALEQFTYAAAGKSPQDYIEMLQDLPTSEAVATIKQNPKAWDFLDAWKAPVKPRLWSDRPDQLQEVTRGFGQYKQPTDYLQSFEEFVRDNMNQVAAMKLVCTRPTELDRSALKELRLLLDQRGFTDLQLRQAWKATRNQDIAADIISFIRTMALGSDLVDHETRVKQAVDQIRQQRSWTKIQEKWLNRIEAQLLKETILRADDLNEAPFDEAGGYPRLNKIFNEELGDIVNQINQNLYPETA